MFNNDKKQIINFLKKSEKLKDACVSEWIDKCLERYAEIDILESIKEAEMWLISSGKYRPRHKLYLMNWLEKNLKDWKLKNKPSVKINNENEEKKLMEDIIIESKEDRIFKVRSSKNKEKFFKVDSYSQKCECGLEGFCEHKNKVYRLCQLKGWING